MSDSASSPQSSSPPPADDLQSALFLDLVAQHAEMALMFLGRVPHPQTGKTVRDLETAKLFISQLEMLEAKTKGNLSEREQALLKQALMATRMAFVEAVEAEPATSDGGQESSGSDTENSSGQPVPAATAVPNEAQTQESSSSATDDERKKFVKKY
jgi:hypothetical protein